MVLLISTRSEDSALGGAYDFEDRVHSLQGDSLLCDRAWSLLSDLDLERLLSERPLLFLSRGGNLDGFFS